MSDTDDTDELLLIPPDQYIKHPETEVINSLAGGTYFKVVNSLISQVNQLHTRVHSIEKIDFNTTIETLDNTMDHNHHANRYKSSDDILISDQYDNSTFSTPQKPRMRYRASSQSPHKQRGRFTAASSKFEVGHTKQVDENSDIVEVNGRIINLTEIENMLEEIETQKKKNDLRLKEQEASLQKTYAWRTGDDEKTLPQSKLMNDCTVPQNPNPDEVVNCNDYAKLTVTTFGASKGGLCAGKSSAFSSASDTSLLTAREVLPDKVDFLGDVKNRRLLSLNDLWGQGTREQVGSLTEKLQEEKLRRQHCEDIIQELQTQSLEMEEKLAVAVQVDKAKDNALAKFHDSWEKVTARLKSLVDENSKLEGTIQEMHMKHEQILLDYSQKVKHYESEAAKALNLAHGSHEKLTDYMDQNKALQERLEQLELTVADFQENLNSEVNKNKKLNEIIVQKELDLTENKNVLSDSRIEIANSKKAIELCQVEFTNMKSQYNSLEAILLEKQMTIKELETKLKNLHSDNDNLQILKTDAEQELAAFQSKMEKTKCELRDFYQQQVELLVQDKLREFQSQLDKAETSLQEEISKRELSIAKTAATHIQQITDKHNLEIKLLEEKQKEEIKYYQMQLQQAQQQITAQQHKLKQFNERRTVLAQQLHKVMEVQWMEALKIINNTKSPYNTTPIDITLDQLKSLKQRSENNLEEVLSEPGGYSAEFEKNIFQPLTETPVSSKGQGSKVQLRDNGGEMQKYVNLLLNKHSIATQMEPMKESSQSNLNAHNTQVRSEEIEGKASDHRRFTKPPWK